MICCDQNLRVQTSQQRQQGQHWVAWWRVAVIQSIRVLMINLAVHAIRDSSLTETSKYWRWCCCVVRLKYQVTWPAKKSWWKRRRSRRRRRLRWTDLHISTRFRTVTSESSPTTLSRTVYTSCYNLPVMWEGEKAIDVIKRREFLVLRSRVELVNTPERFESMILH